MLSYANYTARGSWWLGVSGLGLGIAVLCLGRSPIRSESAMLSYADLFFTIKVVKAQAERAACSCLSGAP